MYCECVCVCMCVCVCVCVCVCITGMKSRGTLFDFSHVYHILLHTHTYTHFQYFKILKIWVATCLYVLVCVGSCSSNLIRLREYKTSVKDKYKTSEVCV